MQEQLPSGAPDKSAQRVERPEGDPQGERSESSSCLFSICYWIPACAGMTEHELIRPSLYIQRLLVRPGTRMPGTSAGGKGIHVTPPAVHNKS